MDAPPEKEDPRRYIEIARRFHGLGLNVPEIFEQDLEQGFLLITDLGDQLYLRHLNDTTVERLYGDALGALIVLQGGIYTEGDLENGTQPATKPFLPEYDEALLQRELEIFREWYLGRHLGLELTVSQHKILDQAFGYLVRGCGCTATIIRAI